MLLHKTFSSCGVSLSHFILLCTYSHAGVAEAPLDWGGNLYQTATILILIEYCWFVID